jgi:hypothetical protein
MSEHRKKAWRGRDQLLCSLLLLRHRWRLPPPTRHPECALLHIELQALDEPIPLALERVAVRQPVVERGPLGWNQARRPSPMLDRK